MKYMSSPIVEVNGLVTIRHFVHQFINYVVLIDTFGCQTGSHHGTTIHVSTRECALKKGFTDYSVQTFNLYSISYSFC